MRAPDFASGVERVKRHILSLIPRKHSDPVQLLMRQHREVDALFLELENSGELAHKAREKTLQSLISALELHTELEERFFYPAARNADEKLVLESAEEHDNIKNMLRKLQATDLLDTCLPARIKVLRELVHHHVREEETQLFPKCEAALNRDKLSDIAARMEALISEREGAPRRKRNAEAQDGKMKRAGAQANPGNGKGSGKSAKPKVVIKPEKHVKH